MNSASATLLQLLRKLGLFASSKLVLDPCGNGPVLPAFLGAVETLLRAAQRECMPPVQVAMLQQMTDSGLFKTLGQLREATAVQLEQRASAAAATTATSSATSSAAGGDQAPALLQLAAARLLLFQVG